MQEHARMMIAAAAYAAITGKKVSSVYSYKAGSYQNIEAKFDGSKISAYDYARGAHFDGTLGSLYDYGDRAHVEMKINGNKAEGYHYGSSHFYEATVSGSSIEVYDYGDAGWFNYSI